MYRIANCYNPTKIKRRILGRIRSDRALISKIGALLSLFVRTPTTKSFHPAVEAVFSGVWDCDFV